MRRSAQCWSAVLVGPMLDGRSVLMVPALMTPVLVGLWKTAGDG